MQRKFLVVSILLIIPCQPLLYNLFHTADEYKILGRYNISPYITVSGLSAGSSFSMMMGFIFSSFVEGFGLYAGSTFPLGIMVFDNPSTITNISRYITWIDYLASRGYIDDTRNLRRSRAYVFHGRADTVVPLPASRASLAVLRHYRVAKLKDMVDKVPAGHCVPTKRYFVPCSLLVTGACDCNYFAVYDMFRTFFPDFVIPTTPVTSSVTGNLFKFNQNEFFPTKNATHYSWMEYGWAYVPKRCLPETGIQCRLHFAFNGCGGSFIESILNLPPEWVRSTGYLEAADVNDLILVMPGTQPDLGPLNNINIAGCYDWLGYTSFLKITANTRFGVQPQAIKKMYERMLGVTPSGWIS